MKDRRATSAPLQSSSAARWRAHRRRARRNAGALVALLVLACGGGAHPAESPPAGSTSSADAAHTADCSWYDTSVEAEAWDETTRAHLRSVCEVEAEFARFVAEQLACTADADCAVVPTSCPLGCGVAVASKSEAAVRQTHDGLRARLDAADSDCSNACEPPKRAVCEGGRCASRD